MPSVCYVPGCGTATALTAYALTNMPLQRPRRCASRDPEPLRAAQAPSRSAPRERGADDSLIRLTGSPTRRIEPGDKLTEREQTQEEAAAGTYCEAPGQVCIPVNEYPKTIKEEY